MATESHVRFVWFWTFWHWSRESYESGELLRDPLQAVASHWDEWYHHEASAEERQRIATVGSGVSAQSEFIAWLFSRWAEGTEWRDNRSLARFVVGQLAHVAPFDQWPAFAEFRERYGAEGPAAVVLAEHSAGAAEDVRVIEALVLPATAATAAAEPVVTEGFRAGEAELTAPRQAALSLLGGSGLGVLLGLWLAAGRRSYARWLRIVLWTGWCALAGMILFLLYGPDLQQHLEAACLGLVVLWGGLMATALLTGGAEAARAWSAARRLRQVLARGQVRLRMNGGLTVKGGSAGLAFCLNFLLALHRAHPEKTRPTWLWRRFFTRLDQDATMWAATGCLSPNAWIKSVVLEPKVRACLHHLRIAHLLMPWQRGGGLPEKKNRAAPQPEASSDFAAGVRMGFAAEVPAARPLQRYRSFHLAAAVLSIGRLFDGWQLALNLGALAVTSVLVIAAPDLRAILLPPAAPMTVPPMSPTPYSLWVSLDTTQPQAFQVVFESKYWASRRAHVVAQSTAPASMRAEIRLSRVARPIISDVEDGTIWIERRRSFLHRDFEPGERVGRYSLSYLFALGRN